MQRFRNWRVIYPLKLKRDSLINYQLPASWGYILKFPRNTNINDGTHPQRSGTHKDNDLWVPGTHKEVNNFESLCMDEMAWNLACRCIVIRPPSELIRCAPVLAQFWAFGGKKIVKLGFPGILRRMHGRNDLKLGIQVYYVHLWNWWDFGSIVRGLPSNFKVTWTI